MSKSIEQKVMSQLVPIVKPSKEDLVGFVRHHDVEAELGAGMYEQIKSQLRKQHEKACAQYEKELRAYKMTSGDSTPPKRPPLRPELDGHSVFVQYMVNQGWLEWNEVAPRIRSEVGLTMAQFQQAVVELDLIVNLPFPLQSTDWKAQEDEPWAYGGNYSKWNPKKWSESKGKCPIDSKSLMKLTRVKWEGIPTHNALADGKLEYVKLYVTSAVKKLIAPTFYDELVEMLKEWKAEQGITTRRRKSNKQRKSPITPVKQMTLEIPEAEAEMVIDHPSAFTAAHSSHVNVQRPTTLQSWLLDLGEYDNIIIIGVDGDETEVVYQGKVGSIPWVIANQPVEVSEMYSFNYNWTVLMYAPVKEELK